MWTLFIIVFNPNPNWEPQSVHATLDDCGRALIQLEVKEGEGAMCRQLNIKTEG